MGLVPMQGAHFLHADIDPWARLVWRAVDHESADASGSAEFAREFLAQLATLPEDLEDELWRHHKAVQSTRLSIGDKLRLLPPGAELAIAESCLTRPLSSGDKTERNVAIYLSLSDVAREGMLARIVRVVAMLRRCDMLSLECDVTPGESMLTRRLRRGDATRVLCAAVRLAAALRAASIAAGHPVVRLAASGCPEDWWLAQLPKDVQDELQAVRVPAASAAGRVTPSDLRLDEFVDASGRVCSTGRAQVAWDVSRCQYKPALMEASAASFPL